MGGGLYDNMWNPYSNGGYGYPQSQNYRPREEVPARGGASPFFNRAAQDQAKKAVRTRTIPVMDGNEAPVRKAPVPERKAPAPAPERKAPVPKKARFESKDAAATKIQSVYRGYSVRKFQPLRNLKVIEAVKRELDTFKNRFQETEQKKKLLTDSQEQLRWGEGIMALLLRLDSLQGVSPEVRLIRKALSKELLMFQETLDTLSSLDSAQLNEEEEDSSDARQNAEVLDAAAPEAAAEVTNAAAAPEDAEAVNAAEPLMSGMDRMEAELRKAFSHRGADGTEATEVIYASAPQEVEPESMDIDTTEQDMGAVEVVKEHAHSDSNKEYAAEAAMDVENSKEQVLTTWPAQEEPEQGESTTAAASSEEDGFVIVSPPHDASGEEMMRSMEQDAEDMAVEAETRDASAEAGCIVPAMESSMQSCLPSSELSDRALLMQVVDENRKLRDMVGKVLQWGKHQNDTIHDLTTRIEQLEQQQHQPPLKKQDVAGRKKGCRSAKVGHKRLPLAEFDSEDAESDEYF